MAIIEDGSILIEDGKIRDVGPTRRIENLAAARSARQIGARGRVVMPGFVDSHVRLVGCEDPRALARMVRQTSAWRLAEDAVYLLRRCLRYGTTTLDAKVGEGLDEASALKVLKAISGLGKLQPIDVIATYCGAIGFNGDWGAPLRRIIRELNSKQLAHSIGLTATQFALLGEEPLGIAVTIECDTPETWGAGEPSRVEHLEQIAADDLRRLAQLPAVAVLMPGLAFHGARSCYAPAREMIAQGVAIALASGYDRALNPSFSMPLAIELACRKLGMAPSEAIVAATINGAYAVGRGDVTGSIEPGKNADLLILETTDYRNLALETGLNPVHTTIVRGEVACENSVSYGQCREVAAAAC